MLAILFFGCQALFAQQVTFYFLPPDNDRWVAGSSYIYDAEKKTTTLMSVDTACGWFKKIFDSKDDVPDSIMIYLGSLGLDKFDMNGTGADPTDPAWIPLKSKFATATTQYFYQDPNSEEGFVFRATKPGNLGEKAAGRCDYKMAAFIYDTDGSVNPSFSGTYAAYPNGNDDIRRGIVLPTLDPETKKPTFNTSKPANYANWKSKESFDAAFTPEGKIGTTITNIARCYDMPFTRSGTNWEFDSDKMRTPNDAYLVGGFFPYILDSAYNDDASAAEYAEKCPACNKKYTVSCFQNPSTTMNNMTKEWRDSTYTGVAAFDRTYFDDGINLGDYYGTAPTGCAVRPGPGNGGTTTNRANLSFCFESHAEFTYEKRQEFLFRGDDDIWVFINNQLVIDLGGAHNAAPGYVDLDTIGNGGVLRGLVEGEVYPIDIFFCERRGTQSNVRVSTNMYITQKSTFFSDPENTENWMCAGIASGNDCASKMSGAGSSKREEFCGNALLDTKNGNYNVDFYMINRATGDTIWLSPTKNPANCQGTGNIFTCYAKDGVGAGSGITVNNAVYSCGGKYQCKGNQKAQDKVNIPSGSYTVYARLMENGKPTANKPLNIDNLKGPTNARIVWGSLLNSGYDLLDAYGEITKKEQSVIAGKLAPIYVAIGNWEEKYTVFDEKELEPTDVVTYSLSGIDAEELDVYLDSLGEIPAVFPRRIPTSGIDTVWVKGSYEMGEQTLEINLSGANAASDETPSLKLSIYQPRLRFTKTDSTFFFVNADNPSIASGYKMWDSLPPYVGKSLPVYVAAWDTLNTRTRPNRICSHCTFSISQKSFVNTQGNSEGIVKGEPLRIVNGRQTIFIKGQDIVEGRDYAQWHITGPSEKYTFAKWDSLQFRGAPVPMPLFSELYDRNGDGIGDSLRIKFSKSFKNGNRIDSTLIPILMEVTWEQGNTLTFYNPDYTATYDVDKDGKLTIDPVKASKTIQEKVTINNLKDETYVRDILYNNPKYNKDFFTENRKYWDKYLNSKEGDSLIVIATDSTAFSKNIATAGYNSGKGKLSSYTPFYDQSQCIPGKPCQSGAFMWSKDGYNAEVLDRVPPIVVRAQYTVENEKKCGSSKDNACRESLIAYLSEPIFAAPGTSSLAISNPFSYCFEYSQQNSYVKKSRCSEGKGIAESDRKSQNWNNITWTWELPQDKANSEDVSYSSYYMPNNKPSPKEYYEDIIKGDDAVELIYYAYKISEDETTRMPKADDWIKIRPPSSAKNGLDVFYDAAGNTANPRERGVLISGKNRYEQDKVVIAAIDKETTPEDPPFGGVFDNPKKPCPITGYDKTCAKWMSTDAKDWARDHLYDTEKGNVVEFLPVPKGTTAKEAGGNFPGSVGAIFSGVKKDEIKDFCGNFDNSEYCKDENGNLLYFEDENGNTKPLTKKTIAKAINLHASVYYHTNLGNYTAHRDPVTANCADKVFQSAEAYNKDPSYNDEKNNSNCLSSESGFYLAWDLKTNKNRFVGTGAYVAITKFYWEIKYKESQNGKLKSKKFDQHEFVELYGVYRTR